MVVKTRVVGWMLDEIKQAEASNWTLVVCVVMISSIFSTTTGEWKTDANLPGARGAS